MKDTRKENKAFTLVELIVVMFTITILAALALPALARTPYQVQRITCANNLKRVGLTLRTWAAANGGYMPMQVSATQGGAAEELGVARVLSTSQLASRGACKIFLCMSNELATPQYLFCPAEYETQSRQAATSFSGIALPPGTVPFTNDLNLSYFVAADASEVYPRMFLTGDHNLGGNANPPTVPLLAAPSSGSSKVSLGTNFNANQGPAFLDNMHGKQGNIGMADGSVEWFGRTNLQSALKKTGDTGRAQGLFTLAVGASGGAGCNRILLP
jgi:prepilin-type processing-associated H-X9-DG protein